MHDYHRRLIAAAQTHGIDRPRLVHRGAGAPRIIGTFAGEAIAIPVLCSPTKATNHRAMIAVMKRLLRHKRDQRRGRQ